MKKTTLSIITAGLLLSPAFAAQDLGEVVVTSSSKVPQKIKETTQNVTIVTAEDIKEHGYQSVPEVLSHTAGFVVASNGGAGQTTSVFIRGLSSDNLLVLVDGVPLTDYTQPSPSAALEHISIDSIDRIEIIKGGQSGIWGTGAVAGTINIITKGAANKDNASISLKLGSHSTKGAGFNYSKSGKMGSISMGADWLKTDSISAIAPKSAEKDGYKNLSYYLNGAFNINQYNTISLFARIYDGKFDLDSGGNANDTISKGTSKQKLYGVKYHYHQDALTIDAKVSQEKIDRDYTYPSFASKYSGESTQLSIVGSYQFSDKNSLAIGAERSINKTKSALNSDKFTNSAIFTSYSHRVDSLLGADTTFNAVLRYDKFDKFKNRATYRLGIKRECKAVEGLHSSANIYTGYKAPSLYQFANALTNLKPETSKGYDISIGYKKYLNIAYFSNKIDNKILYDNAVSYKYYNNKNSVKTTGIEVSSEYVFGDSGFVIGATWTHMFKYKDSSGKNALRIPKNSASVYLDYYFGEASHIGLVANYVGKRRDQYYAPGAWTPSDTTLKSYTTVDLTYNATFKNNINFNVTVKNLFDKKYETVKGYSTEGRSLYANVEYKF